METDKQTEILVKIERRLSRIEAKQEEQCRNIAKIHTRMDKQDDALKDLPCEQHVKDTADSLSEKVGMKHFLAILAILCTLIGGAYTYSYNIETHLHNHETSVAVPHYYQVDETP